MKKRALLLLVLALTAAMLTSCFGAPAESGSSSSAETSSAPYNPKYAFLEYGGTIDLQAAPDLSKTAFCINDRDGYRVVVNDGGADKIIHTSDYLVYGTGWSPDGRYVSFYEKRDVIKRELFLYDTSTGKVTDTGVEGTGARKTFYAVDNIWSSDSSKVIIVTENGGGYYDLAAGKFVEVGQTLSGHYNRGFSFSPDGGKIAYYVSSDNIKNPVPFYVYDIATAKSREVCTFDIVLGIDGWFFNPIWISNTEFLENKYDDAQVYKIDIATGQAKEYIAETDRAVYLSPDGKYLAYQNLSGSDAVIRNIATGAETVIKVNANGHFVFPVWSYDSQRLLLCSESSIFVFGLDGKQIGETVAIPALYSGAGSGNSFSTPVYTKDGLWYEGKKE